MRIVLTFGLAMWFAGWAFAGYRLTGQSFAWLDYPPPATEVAPGSTPPQSKLPATKAEAAKILNGLTAKQRDCLVRVATPEQLAAIQQGKMPSVGPAQLSAIALCLK